MSTSVAVVFDLGNVLLPIQLDLTYAAFSNLTTFFSKDDIKRITEQEGLWVPYESGLESCAEFRDRIRTRFQMVCSDEQFDQAFSALLLQFPPDVVDLIQEVKSNFPVYLLSNTSRIHSRIFLQNQMLFSLFDSIHLSYELSLFKPDHAIYRRVVDLNNLHAKQVVFFDDNLFNFQSAKEFGWDAVLIDPAKSFLQIRDHLRQYAN
jgi:HAD superfamily hydrolase (TIGR01509 family)